MYLLPGGGIGGWQISLFLDPNQTMWMRLGSSTRLPPIIAMPLLAPLHHSRITGSPYLRQYSIHYLQLNKATTPKASSPLYSLILTASPTDRHSTFLPICISFFCPPFAAASSTRKKQIVQLKSSPAPPPSKVGRLLSLSRV